MVPPSRASASAFHEMPLRSTSPACTVRANTNAALSEPLAYAACRVAAPSLNANFGVAVTVTGALNVTVNSMTSPAR